MFIDGEFINSLDFSTAPISPETGGINFGRSFAGFLNGLIAYPIIHARALDDSEVENLYAILTQTNFETQRSI
jgi:hypothetical protein